MKRRFWVYWTLVLASSITLVGWLTSITYRAWVMRQEAVASWARDVLERTFGLSVLLVVTVATGLGWLLWRSAKGKDPF